MNPSRMSTAASSASVKKLNGPRLITSPRSGMEIVSSASSIPAAALAKRVATKNIGAESTPM